MKKLRCFIFIICVIILSCTNKQEIKNAESFMIEFLETVSKEQAQYGEEITAEMDKYFWNNEYKGKGGGPEFTRMTSFDDNYYALYKNDIKRIKKVKIERFDDNSLYREIKCSYMIFIVREQIGEIKNNEFTFFSQPIEKQSCIEVTKYQGNYYIFGYYATNFEIFEKNIDILKARLKSTK